MGGLQPGDAYRPDKAVDDSAIRCIVLFLHCNRILYLIKPD